MLLAGLYIGHCVTHIHVVLILPKPVMDPANHPKLGQLPDEMFTIIKAASNGLGQRLGKLALSGRKAIETPHYLGITSRGVIPHITQDNFARSTSISGVYVGLEDCKYLTLPSRPRSVKALADDVTYRTVSHRKSSL